MPIKKSPNPALTKAYEKAMGDGPIETTLELTEAEIKRMIRAADKLILDAADTAKKIPATAVNAAKTVVDAGLDGAKAAGKSWLGAVKALGKMFGGDFAPGSFASSKPAPKKMSAEQAQAIRDSRADNVKPKLPLPKRKTPTEGMLPRTPVPKLPPTM
tara:strand:+ start:5089 stop:5562 length:474 start_codon:yes stop_codon:yes gene_type:complete